MSETPTPAIGAGSPFLLGEITVEPLAGEIYGPAGRARLDPKVMDVLCLLARRCGQVVPREQLMHAVWPGVVVGDDALSRCIYQLRRHLNEVAGNDRYKTLLETLPKRGYRLQCTPTSIAAGASASPTAARGASAARRAAVLLLCGAALLGIAAAVWVMKRSDYFWRDPLTDARFVRLTDFEGADQDAAISPDGRLVAFLSDRDGAFDAWVTAVGSGTFRNLTRGQLADNRNPAVRTVTFSPNGSEVLLWARLASASSEVAQIDLWAVPSTGGPLRLYRRGAAEIAWSRDRERLLYRAPQTGDPMFLAEPNEQVGRQIFIAPPGSHAHYPVWSPDGEFVYFVYGRPPDDTDIWRISVRGGEHERITAHRARVTHPVFLDEHTLLYLATAEDGTGPWLHTMNPERRVSHRISFGANVYTSLALSTGTRRLVATLSAPRANLWRVPIDAAAVRADARRVDLPHGALSPVFGPDYLLYRVPSEGTYGLWRLSADGIRALWDGHDARIAARPAVERDGRRIAFVASAERRTLLHTMNVDGTADRVLAENLDVRGAPAWSPDGRWIAVAADRGGGPQLFKIPVDGGPPIPLVDEYSMDPAWSPDGRWLIYRGAESGPSFTLKAVTADGAPRALPTLILPRGGQFAFLEAGESPAPLIVLKGELQRKNFWRIDLDTGAEQQLTDFGPEFVIGDFAIAADGSELVFDSVQEQSDVVLLELR